MAFQYHQFRQYYKAWVTAQVKAYILTFNPTVAMLVFLFLFGYSNNCWQSSNKKEVCKSVEILVVSAVKQTVSLGYRSLQITNHALERMAERGVSLDDVRKAVQRAQLFAYVDHKKVKIGYYDHRTNLFLAVDQRHQNLITVIRKVNSGYAERLITRG